MQNRDKIISSIYYNRRNFLSMERHVKNIKNLERKCDMAARAACFAIDNVCDIFYSPIIEGTFISLAKQIKVPLSKKYKKNTILHVLTESCIFGGHTRCVERWIKFCPEFKHSLVLIKQKGKIPEKLINLVKKSGGKTFDMLKSGKIKPVETAIELRKLASEYEYILLHTYANDETPLIAFGTEDFTRPVILFNHADHRFWLGASISDMVADLHTGMHSVVLDRRGVSKNRTVVLGVPPDEYSVLPDKLSARKNQNIPLDRKVVFLSGGDRKFYSSKKVVICDVVDDLVKHDKNIIIYIVGISPNYKWWPELKKKYPNNLYLFNKLDYAKEYNDYVAAADLILDSMPIGGVTTMIDAVNAKKPVLTMNTFFQSDFLINSMAKCDSYKEFIDKAIRILDDEAYATDLVNNVYNSFKQKNSKQKWKKRWLDMLKKTPDRHGIYLTERQDFGDKMHPVSTLIYDLITGDKDTAWSKFAKWRKRNFSIKFNKQNKEIKLFGFCYNFKRIYDV